MPRLTQQQTPVLATWWNQVVSAAFEGYTTTQTIQIATQIAEDNNIDLSFQDYTALSVLYGYAKRMSNAADEVQSALDNAVIGPEHIAVPPWARDEQVMNTSPVWHVIFDFTYVDSNGVLHTEKRTSVFEMTFPETIGDLKDAISEDAQAMADKYGVNLQDTNLLQILAV